MNQRERGSPAAGKRGSANVHPIIATVIKPSERYEKLGPECTWPNDMLAVIQKYKLNWTGVSFPSGVATACLHLHRLPSDDRCRCEP